MVAAGFPEICPNPVKWPQVHSLVVLGHVGSIRHCWQRTTLATRKCFCANAGSLCACELPPALKFKVLARSVGPVFEYRCSRWPLQLTIAVQCRILAAILRIQCHSAEEPAEH